jgi:hypothetical protein
MVALAVELALSVTVQRYVPDLGEPMTTEVVNVVVADDGELIV